MKQATARMLRHVLMLCSLLAVSLAGAQTVDVDRDAPVTVTGRFELWQPEAGTILVEGRGYRLVGEAQSGFVENGRLQPYSALRRGDTVVLTAAEGAGADASGSIRRVERFEPVQ